MIINKEKHTAYLNCSNNRLPVLLTTILSLALIFISISCVAKPSDIVHLEDMELLSENCLPGKSVDRFTSFGNHLYVYEDSIMFVYRSFYVIRTNSNDTVKDITYDIIKDKMVLPGKVIDACINENEDGNYVCAICEEEDTLGLYMIRCMVNDDHYFFDKHYNRIYTWSDTNYTPSSRIDMYIPKNLLFLGAEESKLIDTDSHDCLLVRVSSESMLFYFNKSDPTVYGSIPLGEKIIHAVSSYETVVCNDSCIFVLGDEMKYIEESSKIYKNSLENEISATDAIIFPGIDRLRGYTRFDEGGYYVFTGDSLLKVYYSDNDYKLRLIDEDIKVIGGSPSQSIFVTHNSIVRYERIEDKNQRLTLYNKNAEFMNFVVSEEKRNRYGTSVFIDRESNKILLFTTKKRYIFDDVIEGDTLKYQIIHYDDDVEIYDVSPSFTGIRIYTSQGLYRDLFDD